MQTAPFQPLTPQALFWGPSLPCFQSSQPEPRSGEPPPSVQLPDFQATHASPRLGQPCPRPSLSLARPRAVVT